MLQELKAARIIPLTLKSVADLAGKHFFIPSYQRGYRWDTDQVEALLNDLAEFEAINDSKKFYCLQPLVVFKQDKAKDKDDDVWEVVDGQQRLTTIFLILKHLNGSEAGPFNIRYERHQKELNEVYREDLQSAFCENAAPCFVSPDIFYLRKGNETIVKWFSTHKVSALASLKDREGAWAKFIWHEIEDRDKAIPTFTRLNAGKIRLKDSELIRALFLRRGELDITDGQHIALRWDQIERRLQDQEFWSFLNPKGAQSDNRIELLFQWITFPKKGSGTKDREVFGQICDKLKNNDERRKMWQTVEDLFGTLDEWFENNCLFHLVGFLVEQGESIPNLQSDAKNLGKNAFIKHIKKKIRGYVLGNGASFNNLEKSLDDLQYEKDSKRIKAVLLCLNLATLEVDATGTVRFSFYAYKHEKNGWDIEHIRATADRPPKYPGEIKTALIAIRAFAENGGIVPEVDFSRLKNFDLENQAEDNLKKMEQLYADLRDKIEGKRALPSNNGLMNLTLLDAETNRGYGNSPFVVKRKWVLSLDQQAKYLLPCTRNVFTKSYSPSPECLWDWDRHDANAYLTSIKKSLTHFFADTWE